VRLALEVSAALFGDGVVGKMIIVVATVG